MATPTARDKILDAALALIRERGFAATTVDDLCARAKVTKGAFFHHFESKEQLGVATVEHWSTVTGALFARATYHTAPTALERVLAYVDLRRDLLRGGLAEFTCVAGTMVQETYGAHPRIREACGASIFGHASTLTQDLEDAMREHRVTGTTPESLAAFTQAALQGAFILAKAKGDVSAAVDAVAHLRRYLELLFAKPRLRRAAKKPSASKRRTLSTSTQ
jgi:TetR/AcrR family transcriptional repressor of nem operon